MTISFYNNNKIYDYTSAYECVCRLYHIFCIVTIDRPNTILLIILLCIFSNIIIISKQQLPFAINAYHGNPVMSDATVMQDIILLIFFSRKFYNKQNAASHNYRWYTWPPKGSMT